MNNNLLELAHRHGALKVRIEAQREALARHAKPLESVFALGDKAVAGADWVKHHPLPVGAALAVLAIIKPARAWRWARRGLFVWRGWKKMQSTLRGSK